MFDDYNELPLCHDIRGPKVRTKDVILDNEIKFSSLLLEPQIQEGLAKCGYDFLSPIQKNALPLALTGKSIIAHSKSGTGKTLIYLLTSLNLFLKCKPERLFTLILAPTREIAKQIYDVCKNVSSSIKNLRIEYFIGGISLDLDVIKCRTCHIAVGAPGRIKHLINLGELKTQDVQLLVLDEVDLLINNKEFAIGEIVTTLPASRQTIVCTATYSDDIDILLRPFSADLRYINMNEEGMEESASNMLIGIKQFLLPVYSDSTPLDTVRLRNTLVKLLKNFNYDQCFVFVNYISLVKSVYNFLVNNDLSAMWLSSEQNQSVRMATVKKLKMNEYKILVTTDLAARGIDVHNVNLVVNLGLPMPPEVYVHRMGRAGRFGSEGSVVTIVHEGEESRLFVEMLRYVITEPVNLHVMPLGMNAEISSDNLKVLKCEPQPNSPLIREVIAKHLAKIEGQSTPESKTKKSKKKSGKKKAKDKPSKECSQRNAAQTDDTSSVSEEEIVKLKQVTHLETLKQRFTDYMSTLQSDLDERVCPHIEMESLMTFLQPAKTSCPKTIFSDYYQEPNVEEVGDITPVDIKPIDTSLLPLAEFSRNKNSFIDSQSIPLNVSELFSLIDYDEESVMKEEITDRMRKLKKEIWEKVRSLSSSQKLLEESTNCNKNRKTLHQQNVSSNDIEVPQIKFKPKIEHKEDSSDFLPNTSTKLEIDRPSLSSLSRTVDDTFQRKKPSLSSVVEAPSSSITSSYTFKPEYRTAIASQSDEIGTSVQCPQCRHKFSVQSEFVGIDQQSNMLSLLASYVDPHVAQKIYQSQLDFISSCIQGNE